MTTVVILKRKIKAEFSLSDRSKMKFPILIGRKLLKNKFIVDVSQKNISMAPPKNSAITTKESQN
jgi:hypothetical protein